MQNGVYIFEVDLFLKQQTCGYSAYKLQKIAYLEKMHAVFCIREFFFFSFFPFCVFWSFCRMPAVNSVSDFSHAVAGFPQTK